MELKKILKKAFDAGYDTSLMYNNLGDEAHKDFEEFYKKEVTEQLILTDVSQQRELLITVFEKMNRPQITMLEVGEYEKLSDELLSN